MRDYSSKGSQSGQLPSSKLLISACRNVVLTLPVCGVSSRGAGSAPRVGPLQLKKFFLDAFNVPLTDPEVKVIEG